MNMVMEEPIAYERIQDKIDNVTNTRLKAVNRYARGEL
jgi:hypothetical protein